MIGEVSHQNDSIINKDKALRNEEKKTELTTMNDKTYVTKKQKFH